jgi:hypothetical protein
MSYSTDDEGLMAELAEALEQVAEIPPNRRLAARGSYTWRTVDEELLALTHDSLELADAAVRGDSSARTLGFEGDGLSLQLELDGERVFGQVLSTGGGGAVETVVVESVEDGTGTTPVNAAGVFSATAPVGPVRFGVSLDGALRRTSWVVLRPRPQEG